MADQISNWLINLKQVRDLISETTVQLPELKKKLDDLFVDQFTIKDLGELGSKEAKLQHHARELESHFSITKARGNAFIGRVEAIFDHCNDDEIVKIQEEVTKGNFRCVKNFIAEFKAKMADCEEIYQLFNENHIKVQTSSTDAATECNKQAEEGDTKKMRTQTVGGCIAVGLLITGICAVIGGVGIAASVAFGALTFGVGTSIGLVIIGTAVTGVTGSSGVAIAVATRVIASKYDKFSKKLRQIKESFDKLHESTCLLAKNLDDLKVQVDSHNYVVKNLEKKYLEKANSTEEKDISHGASVVGGLDAGAGVVASVVAGVFTFGVGTAVGLTITGIAATVTSIGGAGVATAVATGFFPSKSIIKSAKPLQQIKQAFDNSYHTACSLLKTSSQLKVKVNGLDYKMKYLEETNHKEQKDTVCKNLHKIRKDTVCLQTTAFKQHIQREEDRL